MNPALALYVYVAVGLCATWKRWDDNRVGIEGDLAEIRELTVDHPGLRFQALLMLTVMISIACLINVVSWPLDLLLNREESKR